MENIEIPENIETLEQLNEWLKGDSTVFYRLKHKSSRYEAFNFHYGIGCDNKPFNNGTVYFHRQDTARFHRFKFKNLRRLFNADIYRLV